jgi:response regulator RpfG family c-di-GMP phosphodiesterase
MAARTSKVEPTDSWKGKIQASMLLNRLKAHGDGKVRLSGTQVKAIEVILDRITPKLSAVEQTVTDSRDSLTEDQLLAQLCAIFAAKPELYRRVVEVQSAAALVHESGAMLSDIQRSSLSEQGTAAATQRGVPAAPAPGPERAGVEPPKKNA